MSKGLVNAVGKRAGLVVLYLMASTLSRVSVVDSDPMALVWPAGGLAIGWLITRRSRREWLIDVPLITVAASALSLATGRTFEAMLVLAASNLTAVLSVALLYQWWSPATVRRGDPPSKTPQAMLRFLGSIAIGSLLGVAVGAVGFWLTGRDPSPTGLVVWFGRNVCSMAAVGVTIMLIVDRVRHGRTSTTAGRWPELVLLFAATGALTVIDYFSELPVTFLLPAAAVWAGSRFTSLPVAVHSLVGGGAILWLTYVGEGPFSALGDDRTNILLAQIFVAMSLVIGLFLVAAGEARTAMSQEMMTFARRAAHDLRNPLTAVESWTAELAAARAAGELGQSPATPAMIAGIERAAARMRSLVDALLADAAAGDRAPDQHEIDLPELVAEVASEYSDLGQVRTLGVRNVAGDPVLLRQLMDNLLANAVKYVGPGQPADVTVSAHRNADRVVVRVSDNGIGVPPEAREWIFEPFRRAHGNAYPGSGLGLSTCRRIVERHGGSMRALPREDGPGSVFEFDLPQAPVRA